VGGGAVGGGVGGAVGGGVGGSVGGSVCGGVGGGVGGDVGGGVGGGVGWSVIGDVGSAVVDASSSSDPILRPSNGESGMLSSVVVDSGAAVAVNGTSRDVKTFFVNLLIINILFIPYRYF
jgi:hypothetical protein